MAKVLLDGVTISNELVKPSSPTPPNLRTHTLSCIDHIAPPMLVPVVLYFPHTTDPPELTRLKQSLSLTLTRFYPLAGRINSDRKSIDCNDEGVPFAVVRFPGHKLSDLLVNPDPKLPSSLLPCTDSNQCPNSALLLVQFSYFDGGGVAIGAFFSHITVDAGTLASFLKSWSATACGSTRPVSPDYTPQSMFPQGEDPPKGTTSDEATVEVTDLFMASGKPVLRRYRFDSAAISSLKSQSGVARPSRVEVLAALFWRSFMAASLANNHAVSMVTQPVDIRRRARPKFSPDSFGNLMSLAAATSPNETGIGIGDLVKKLRDSVSIIDDGLIDRMRDEGISALNKVLFPRLRAPEGARADLLMITSWCGFGLYGSEFGWGKPAWISRCDGGNDSNINEVVLMDTRDGEGVEAWVVLDEKYMAVFDGDEELKALASIDPNPLHT